MSTSVNSLELRGAKVLESDVVFARFHAPVFFSKKKQNNNNKKCDWLHDFHYATHLELKVIFLLI